MIGHFGASEEIIAMTDTSSRLEAQLQARLSVLELVVGMMIREDVLSLEKVRPTFLHSAKM